MERDAFTRMYERHYHLIRNYCLRRLELTEAEDATAEVFVIAWRRFDAVPDEPNTPLWLYGVARNVVRTAKRSGMRRTRLDHKVASLRHRTDHSMDSGVGPWDEVLLAALGSLSERDQEILKLRVWEELSGNEIAEVLGISRAAVNTRLHRATKRMIAEVERIAGPEIFEELK